MIHESSIEKFFTSLVKKHGGLCYKFVSPGNAGVPDRIVIFHGIAHFVELKQETGRLRSAQKIQAKRLAALGFDVQVIRSKEQAKLWVELTASLAQFAKTMDIYASEDGSGELG